MAAPIKIVVRADTNSAESGLKRVTTATERLDRQVRTSSGGMSQFGKTMSRSRTGLNRWAKGALQQAGFQVGDFAVQVANGTDKMQAFGQQGSQMLGVFGPIGAILGAGVAIFSALSVATRKSGRDLSNFGSILGSLRDPLESVVTSMKDILGQIKAVAPIFAENVDTMLIAAGLWVSMVGVKMVGSMIAASAASGMLASALATLRLGLYTSVVSAGRFSGALTIMHGVVSTLGAGLKAVGLILMRFLPIALFVGLAKLIEIFLRLQKGAGGFGEAIKLLRDVFVEAFDRMVLAGIALRHHMAAAAAAIDSAFLSAIANIQHGWQGLMSLMAGGFDALPGMEGTALKLHEFAVRAGAARHEMDALIASLDETSASFRNAGNLAFDAATAPMSSWQALKQAIEDGTTSVNLFGDAMTDAEEDAGGAADKITESMKRIQSVADTIKDSMTNAFMSMVEGTKTAVEAFRDMARAIIAKLFEVLVVQQLVGNFNAQTGTGTGLVGLIMSGLGSIGLRASGGPVSAGRPYVVGERGPELIIPSRSGHVVPNEKIGTGRDGGITIVQNIDFSTGVQDSARAEIMAFAPRLVEMTKAAVLDAKRRGGSYGNAF